jgi:hypothetical protein
MNSYIREIFLDRLHFAASRIIYAKDVQRWYPQDIECVAKDCADDMVLWLTAVVLGEELEPVVIRHPATWWDAVKERFFSDWLLRRFPVTYTIHSVEFSVAYPNFKCKLPKESNVIYVKHREGYE